MTRTKRSRPKLEEDPGMVLSLEYPAALIEYRDQLKINKHDLDSELEQQPHLLAMVSEETAHCIAERDADHIHYKRMYAKIAKGIRAEANKNGKKLTETAIDNLIHDHPDYIDARQQHIESKHTADIAEGLLASFTQRGFALKDLVKLHLGAYYEDTSVNDTGRAKRRDPERVQRNRARIEEGQRKKRTT